MQATINVSLDVPQTYSLETLKQELTEYAKKLVAKAAPKPQAKARKHDAICGIMKTQESDEAMLERYLKTSTEVMTPQGFVEKYLK